MSVNELPERPLLKPWYRIARDDDRVILEYGGSAVVFEGSAVRQLVPSVLPLLDGSRTVAEITSYLGEPVGQAVERLLDELAGRGLLTEGPEAPGSLSRAERETTELLAASTGMPPKEVLERFRTATVGIAGGGAAAVEIARLLRLSGVATVEPASLEHATPTSSLDLVVAAPHRGEVEMLSTLNRLALARGLLWLSILPFDGETAAVGPLYVPGETCCYRCFRTRRAACIGYPNEFRRVEGSAAGRSAAPLLSAAIAGLTALVVLRWLSCRDPSLPGVCHMLELGTTLAISRHVVYRAPRCPECSGLDGLAPPLPWYEEAAP